MARNPRNAAAGATVAAAGAVINLADVQKSIEQANQARTDSIGQLQTTRQGHVDAIAQIDTMLNGLGVETETATPTRRGKRGGRRAAKAGGGGKGSRGKRDPLGMKGYIAQALVKAGGPLSGAALTEAIGKAGWPNANSPTFNTQVYQVAGKMEASGLLKSPGRGQYVANAKTAKFLTDLQASIKSAA